MELDELLNEEELRKSSKEELVSYANKANKFITDVLVDGNYFMFYALNKQMKDIANQMSKIKVDIQSEEDMDLFDNIIKLAIQADKISEGLEKVKGRIKTDQTGHIKEAEEGTVEYLIANKKWVYVRNIKTHTTLFNGIG